jgi:hypothetical protein
MVTLHPVQAPFINIPFLGAFQVLIWSRLQHISLNKVLP